MSALAARFFRTFDWVLLSVFLFNFFAIAGIYSLQTDKPPSKPLSPLILGLGWLGSLAIITVLFGRKIIGRATLLFAISLVTFALAVLGASLNTRFSP